MQALLNAVDHLRSLDSQRSAPDKLESILEVIPCSLWLLSLSTHCRLRHTKCVTVDCIS
jgi:hypothetical protein